MAAKDNTRKLSLNTTKIETTTPNSNVGHHPRSTGSAADIANDSSTKLPENTSLPPITLDAIDVSHIQLKSPKTPLSSLSVRFTEASLKLADALRISSPLKPSGSFNSFAKSSHGAYEVISPSSGNEDLGERNSQRLFSKSIKRKSLMSKSHIKHEDMEEIDMGLLNSAAKLGEAGMECTSAIHEEDENETVGYDISSLMFGGSPNDEERNGARSPFLASSFTRNAIQIMEAKGNLTGGLGVEKALPEVPVSELEVEVEAQSPRLSRRLTRAGALSRNQTVKNLGQSLADKRGEAIKVVMDAPPPTPMPVDLSSYAGDGATHYDFNGPNRNPTFGTSNTPPVSEIFYPTANWKPFSMRWPYLTALILISITLAVSQEYLYQDSASKAKLEPKQGLYTFTSTQDLATWSYFSFKYLPTMIAVTFGVLWQFTDNEVKRLEAYYQLSTPAGALAAESINVDYITFINLLRPIRALRYKHFAVFESSLATLLAATLVPPLLAASVILDPPKDERLKDPEGSKYIHISPVWSRFLTVVLLIIALLGCLLLRRLQTRHSGLMADVHGIAGIAAMANKSHILVDFKDMDVASPETIHKKLRNRRYELRDSSLRPNDSITITEAERAKYDQFRAPSNPHPLMLRLSAGIPFILFLLLFLMFLPIVLFTNADVITNNQSWFITVLAVAIKLIWNSLETDMRMLEPFFILSRRYAPPSVLTMDYTGIAWGLMPIKAFMNGHFLLCLAGIGSILAEILTVCVTSFSGVSGKDFNSTPTSTYPKDAGEETPTSFWVSFALSLSILLFLTTTSSLIYYLRHHPFLPRQPNTIASVLAFIHQSRMLYDFVDTQKLDFGQMVGLLEGLREKDGTGKRYGLGWFRGRDGEIHCGVDEEVLMEGYRHGRDVREAVQTKGVGSWEVW